MNKSDIDWIVVFEEANCRTWWNFWLKPGYSHVYATRWDGFNWIKVEPRIGFLDVEIMAAGPLELDKIVDPGYSDILHVIISRDIDRLRVPWGLGILTCVETIKDLLGIRAPFVITPWQLAKHLRGTYGIQTENS